MNSAIGSTVFRRAIFPVIIVLLLCNALKAVAGDAVYGDVLAHRKLKDLYFGEALFYAYQGKYFDAISRLDAELAQYHGLDEPKLNSLYYHIGAAEFSVGDFELYYRMQDRAGQEVKAVIEGNVQEKVRNEAIYRLAKIYYQEQKPLAALNAIERLKGEVPEKIRYEEPFLRAEIYMATGKFTDAIKLLKKVEGEPGVKGYAGYNLGVAMFQSGKEQQGIAQLDKVGQLSSKKDSEQAIRDKANLVLGFRLLEAKHPKPAKKYLQRVRLNGPFSNKALLGAGWAAAATGAYDRAIVPWTILSKRDDTDKSVQESLIGLPYAYGKLNLFGKAAILYGHALDVYSKELKRLDASIASIREGKFLSAIMREERKADKNWLIDLRKLPDAPETYYLRQMMASRDFQESLKNYADLTDLAKRLEKWGGGLGAYENIIKMRAAYYRPLLPNIDGKFRALDSKMKLRLAQRARLRKRLNTMLVIPRHDFLMTAKERILLARITEIENSAKQQGVLDEKTRQRIARLKGVITWNIDTEYDKRFTKAAEHLHELDGNIKRLKTIYRSFVRARQAATLSYEGYDAQINRLRIKIREALQKVRLLKARQGHTIEVMATNELERRRKRIEEYQVKARFAMADSYDRATKGMQNQKKEGDSE
ncbi:MAG: tetratricopeptide repeat protein [Gammaproteobacteria bacterium]